ncbi:hypothetical protein M436DRAFT_42609 [Aureobasidium namibiae CBS 147.97]|uniref:Chromosome segregation ATPase family protein n=1 Tax=Aureobasidium namibiae CBS 147.97 TaxID=1043004 RepID=A0A074XJN5_9PEZI|nr:uncharacterized protein M436DRAFT_42609 [Aureobasidium namibiae CBS 147.97]KEQ74756.1 hypothetical protein M436DRAFT_42609 [Aureobasidium namibiae CBS 147.97]
MGLTRHLSKLRWDSSDPDRAPPPLPIPPNSPGLATRSTASANIQATAQRLTERARESMPASAYTTNPPPSTSPDKSLIKGAHHRRLQSLQTGSVRDLRSYLDGMRNTSPERPTSRSTANSQGSPTRPTEADYFSSPPQDHSTPTPADRNALRDAPNLRPASRPRAILGENTPPSATMLALQTMAARDAESSFNDITNSTSSREPKTLNEMMAQLTNITNITSGMQKEMAQLNRRSKDNAADLIGLKQAADSRDEEIRRNLRDLLSNVSASDAGSVFGGRSSAFGLGLLENKGLTSPPAGGRPFGSLPRSNSHGSFLDPGSPNPFSMDGAASVAMLEKIIREMVTKDGQDRLLSTLSELLDKHSRDNVQAIETAQKVADLSDFIKEKSGSHALVRHSSDAQDDEQKSKAIDAMSADILRLLHKIKDSTSQSGGLSNEIKALLQNLRGEVLGMGRELGRQLDQANSTARVAEDGSQIKTDVEEIVNQGLSQLREHMEHIIQQNSQQLIMSNHQDENKNKDMYDIVKSAITEHSTALVQAQPQSEGLDRASILEAVKDAIEEFRPEIELQQFGLERDEILSVLKEGLQDYRSNKEPTAASGANIEEVESAMQRALQEFNPPRSTDEMVSFKEDLLASIRQSIEELKSAGPDNAATHAIVLGAVREGLENHGPNAPREFDISRDDLFDAVKASLDGSTLPFGSFGEQVLDQLRNLIEEMKTEFKQYSAANGRDTEQVLDAIKDGLESLRHEVESYVDRAQDVTGKDEIVDVVRSGLEQLRGDVQGYCAEGPSNGRNEMIDYIKAEFEHLHEAVSGLGSRDGEEGRPSSTSEILIAVASSGSGVNTALLEAIQGEFQQIRHSLGTGGSRADTEEVLDAVRLGLDDLQSSLEKKIDNPEMHRNLNNELMDTLNEGLDNMRSDVSRIMDKPVDMTVNYEILETLKEGVASLRADLEKLTGGERSSSALGSELILADAPGEEGSRELSEDDKAAHPASLKDRMEALFAQLHIKVEGLAASIGDMPATSAAPAEGLALKEDLSGMEETLRQIQDTLLVVAEKERVEVDNAVTKEDTDAIETLLRNTKAQLEELPATTASREQLDEVEAVVRSAREAIDGLATKEDVAVVEILLKDLFTAFEDSKSKAPGEDEEEESASHLDKADLDALGMLCTEIKEKILELNLPDPEALPSKADVEQITGLINDFRESHDKVREGYENDIAITAKAFDDRRKEAEEMAEAISGVKTFLEEVKAEILAKVEEGAPGMADIEEAIKSIDDKVAGDEGIGADIKELLETIKNEFERSHESLGGIKIDHEQNSSTLLEKHAEHKDAIVAAVTEKVDSCFDGMMSKYDDAQAAAHEKVKSMEEQVGQQKEMLNSTKEMTDELKLSIDTLGTSLTAFIPSFNEATEKISEDSKTVFEKVEGAMLKMDEHNDGLKTEHQTTRDEIVKVVEAVALLQGESNEYNPQFSMSLKELNALVSAHYEYSQQLAATAEEQAKTGALPALLPAPVEPVEKYDDTAVHEKLDRLVNDTAVHEKLDTLVNLAGEAGAATAQMERLDEIHAQVKATAAEVSAFVAIQQKQITDGQESKEREAEELALLLERRQVQKDNIESDISSLSEEKESLQAIVEALRAEKDALAAQKARLNGDVSALHTALDIRREELHVMDEKADALERRILEGLIDHSRAMLLTQKTPKTSPKKKLMRDLRLPSDASTTQLPAPTTPSLLQSHALAMKTRGMPKKTGTTPNTGERRIMSLSQISRNLPSGAAAYAAPTPSLVSAQGAINRSQSLKNNKLRKISWGTARAAADKENDIEEVTEIDSNYGGSRPVSRDSEYRPQSRDYDSRPVSRDSLDSSYYNSSRRSVSYAGSQSAWTESQSGMTDDGCRTSLGTLGTYETGSYMTGSDIDRRTSIGSTIRSTMDRSVIHEEDYDSDLDSERYVEPLETPALAVDTAVAKDVGQYAPPSDSGIGSDLPTGALQGNGDYFAGAVVPATVDEDRAT